MNMKKNHIYSLPLATGAEYKKVKPMLAIKNKHRATLRVQLATKLDKDRQKQKN